VSDGHPTRQDTPTDPSTRRPLRIGLTGPIGCGKSTVAARLATHGAVVLDADRLARDVTAPGEPAVAAIAERFGNELVDADGRLDRGALGRIVFADPAALADLEAIVHPAVRPRILAELEATDQSSAPAVVLEAIRLVDGGYVDLVDEVWLVDCSPAIQRARVLARGGEADDADRRIGAQAGLVARSRAAATRTVETDGTLEDTERRVDEALTAALAAALSR
jgi:dephospho-CoA kinase